ncbi:hypothetical protein BU26DRAFT_86641 [Trematosphaeria pertusa]|uniref:Uncharacterized protein n=1 Tax=Trematosphaeria pertusa TaxID=390896 RepID=A0A6A6I3F8_9PLEO|nr:uncharacterized protein BU26DRAFT_86641 [Trematosphaeria pertusa]KAF2244787.1 hypothetical protein BU26DRAFT_86641 [Trematosphaeria pertusa]
MAALGASQKLTMVPFRPTTLSPRGISPPEFHNATHHHYAYSQPTPITPSPLPTAPSYHQRPALPIRNAAAPRPRPVYFAARTSHPPHNFTPDDLGRVRKRDRISYSVVLLVGGLLSSLHHRVLGGMVRTEDQRRCKSDEKDSTR